MIDKIKHLKLKKEQVITIGLVFVVIVISIISIISIIKLDIPSNLFRLKSDIISLQENETMFLRGSEVNIIMKKLSGNKNVSDSPIDKNITSIIRSNSLSITPTTDNIVSTSNSNKPIYMWYNNGVLYWYTEANKVYLNPNSSSMFINLTKLETIPELSQFDTSRVTNMRLLFRNCSSLKSLNLNNFDTSKVTDMSDMFYFCENLTSLNLSNFNTSKVTDMGSMFSGCSNLTSLNLGDKFNTSITNMRLLFRNCSSLKSLNLNNFDTSNVTDMYGMFYFCENLTSLNLSNFNTSKVTDMSDMFYFCENLTSLNLSNFNTSKVTDMSMMFKSCYKLKKIIVSNKFSITSLPANYPYNNDRMFEDCYNLVGGNGTKYNENYNDKTYARIDKSGTPGYFTSANTRMYIDIPSGNPQIITDTLTIAGWTMSHITNRRVDIYVDSAKVSDVTYLKRDGVISAITDCGTSIENPNPGYSATYNIKNLSNGTHTVTVKVIDVINNTKILESEETFTINRATVNVPTCPDKTYNGSSQTLLSNGTGYTVSNNTGTNAGSYNVTLTLNSNYQWNDNTTTNKTVTCKINGYSISNASVSSVSNQTYTGSEIKPSITVSALSKTLTKDTDYILSYKNNTNIGTATITITGKGNYTGIKEVNFSIIQPESTIDISKLTIKNNIYVLLDKNSTKSTITSLIGTTSVKVLSNNIEMDANTKLKTGDILNVNNTNYQIIILGDVDLNGEINVTDIVGIRKRIKQGPSTFTEIQLIAADYNQDEYINVTDIVGLRKLIKGT